jgi:hypothetical protein
MAVALKGVAADGSLVVIKSIGSIDIAAMRKAGLSLADLCLLHVIENERMVSFLQVQRAMVVCGVLLAACSWCFSRASNGPPQVENCAVTISSDDVGAVVKREDAAGAKVVQVAVDDFPALGKSVGSGGMKPRKSTHSKQSDSPASAPPSAAAAAAAGPSDSRYTQITVLLDARGWSLKMASLDALR